MKYNDILKLSNEQFGLNKKEIDYLLKYYFGFECKETTRLDNEKMSLFIEKCQELSRGIPIQYVVGNVDFYGYTFNVDQRVLIPRFETEQLVDNVIRYIKEYFQNGASVLDVATGSGVIGIILKKELYHLNVTLTDISKEALRVAAENAEKLNIDVKIYKSDMLDETIKKEEKYDILISNPPYLTPDEEIMDSVIKYEPAIALYGGEDGVEYYEQILSNAKKVLKEKALIAFEIGANQAEHLIMMANKYFPDSKYEIKKDLEGRDRMFFLFYNLNV